MIIHKCVEPVNVEKIKIMLISSKRTLYRSLGALLLTLVTCGFGPNTTLPQAIAAPLPAFPGALGFGADATGGRSGTVYRVTNLNDSGAGSFRDAVSQGNRIVVFTVGGYVVLKSAVPVSSNITIAGQTAPGDGIGIMGNEVSFSGSNNIICRYIRFRQGTIDTNSSHSGINLLNVTNAIFDHISIEFAQWNNIDAVGANNITIQNSIDAEPIGQQFNAHTETVGGNFTWYNDIFSSAHNRSPLAKINTQYVNNVVYNFQAGYTAGNSANNFRHDIVNNAFITGPSTTNSGDAYFQMTGQSVYISGNTENGSSLGYPGGTTHLSVQWSVDTASLPTSDAANALAHDIAYSGDLPRDDVDSQVIR